MAKYDNITNMAEQGENSAVAAAEKPPESLEHTIHKSERALGVETEYDRQAEASLFIDKKFLSYALITGVTKKPERVFSDKAWADYLDGRLFARQYGKQDLTPDFIRELHTKLTQRSDPKISGKIRDVGVVGASYDDGKKPVTYTAEQVKAIEKNPLLSFRREPPGDEESTTGFIVYPHPKSGAQTQEAIAKDLDELCEWFNNAKKQEAYNPHIVAGLLQHRLISLHSFLDSNGRMTRVLMNWSLENDGKAPSVIDNPGEDILTDEDTWISYIAEGSKQYKAIKKRQAALEEAGIDNINALFDLGQDKAFYEYIFRHLKQAPPLPTNGDKHKHQVYEEFLADFKDEMGRFQEYMRVTSKLKTADSEREISQGGLITSEFMDFASSPNTQVLPMELRKQFFTDTEAYRGGIVDGEVDDEKICQMFQGYTGVGVGYRALQHSHLSATSLQGVSQPVIRESMEYYNKMFASSYFAKKHPDIENPYASSPTPVRDLNTTVREHTAGRQDIWNSPFASTSLNYGESRGWANRFWADCAKNSRHGVLFKAQLPREGIVMTFGQKFEGLTATGCQHEYEVLVTGGLQPASITVIEVYDQGNTHGNPDLRATKVEGDGKVSIVLEDRHGEFVVSRTYAYNPDAARFVLADEVATEIPSTAPIDQPAVFDPHGYKDLSHIIGGFTKEYESPFKSKKIYSPLENENYNFSKEINILNKYKDDGYKIIITIPTFFEKELTNTNIEESTYSIISEILSNNYKKNLLTKIKNEQYDGYLT